MRAVQVIVAATLPFAAFLAGCDRKQPTPAPKTGPVTYDVRGVLQRADPSRGIAIVAHEEIPGYMEAMTMEFDAASPAELAALEPGDVLTFRLTVTETESKIDRVKKVGHTTPPIPSAPSGVPLPGMALPEATLVDDTGRAFQLADRKGTVLAITFIFTRCPLPDYCPRMSAHFAAAQQELAQEKCNFLSVTIDPAHDTPARLAAYASGFRKNPERWTFATGDAAEIRKLTSFAGLEMKGDGLAITHNLRTLVVDTEGRVTRVFQGNDWQPAELIAEIRKAQK